MEDIFASLGPVHSWKSYRMHTDSFYKLYDMLFGDNPYPNKHKNDVTPNGPITSKSILSQALYKESIENPGMTDNPTPSMKDTLYFASNFSSFSTYSFKRLISSSASSSMESGSGCYMLLMLSFAVLLKLIVKKNL